MSIEGEVLPFLRLQMHIEQPSLEECWSEGYVSVLEGGVEDDNPYAVESLEYQHWNQGWWAGFYGEESWYTEDELCESANRYRKATSQYFSAANESDYGASEQRMWATRIAKIAGAIAVTFAAVELFELSL